MAKHSSGRNSGVLHAGFYYTSNSLKAKFTRDGYRRLTEYCKQSGLRINENGKVVVASAKAEVSGIDTLYSKGIANGVDVRIINQNELKEIEPNEVKVEKALYSPSTATVAPVKTCNHIKDKLKKDGVAFWFDECFDSVYGAKSIKTKSGNIYEYSRLINASGLYADKIAKKFGFSQDYTIIPFKGIYLIYTGNRPAVRTNTYPVPNLKNSFLGVHYTVTVDNIVKIGSTAIPAFWRENYNGLDNFRLGELVSILMSEAKLFLTNAFGFRGLAFEEMHKYNRKFLCRSC